MGKKKHAFRKYLKNYSICFSDCFLPRIKVWETSFWMFRIRKGGRFSNKKFSRNCFCTKFRKIGFLSKNSLRYFPAVQCIAVIILCFWVPGVRSACICQRVHLIILNIYMFTTGYEILFSITLTVTDVFWTLKIF